MRRAKDISAATKLVWSVIYFKICGGRIPLYQFTITAKEIADELNIDDSNAPGISNLAASGFCRSLTATGGQVHLRLGFRIRS